MKITLLNQCFYPDVVATGQYLTDLALGLVERGHEVTVISSDRGYDNSQLQFVRRERWQGIEVIRLPSLALGKKTRWRRAVSFAALLGAYLLRLVLMPRQDVVVALTSPPLIAFIAALFVKIKGGRLVYWIMDLNPDEAVAAGWLREQALLTRLLHAVQNFALRQADPVVALDRFMSERIAQKGIAEDRLRVIALWPLDDDVRFDRAGRDSFRLTHGLSNKFVVMHSGNHSPCHPLNTLLAAADQLSRNQEIVFCFVGGGSELAKVREFASSRRLENIVCLPYQPRSEIAASLSAADLHVVIMGEPFVGIIHPCKIYNVLKVGAPFLYIGPGDAHVTDIISQRSGELTAYAAEHGDADRVTRNILAAKAHQKFVRTPPSTESLSGGLMKLIEIVETPYRLTPANDAVAAATAAAPGGGAVARP
ncbi:MAG TPA: glycosyltransferase family 4 protein [Pyrinomonadaceae bacterium]|nr:glycosyltransferase family 4 protein [Pyrinomonadaceae bacterium]